MSTEVAANLRLEKLWDKAVDSYNDSTRRDPTDRAFTKRLSSVEDLHRQIELGHLDFTGWRKKDSKFLSGLSATLKVFVKVSEFANSAISATPYAPVSVVLGAVVFLVKAADGVSESYDSIERLFEKLSGFTHRLEQYVASDMNPYLQEKMIEILSCLLGILGRSEKIIRDGRLRKMADAVLGRDDKVKALFETLEKLFDDERGLIGSLTYGTVQQMDKTMNKSFDLVSLSLREATTERRNSEQTALLEKHLITPAQLKNFTLYSNYTDDTLKDSGKWLLGEEKFKDWMQRKSLVLWVVGLPGAGKSYLSAIAISTLKRTYPQDLEHPNRVSVGFFYVKWNEQDLKDLTNLLKSIAYQIASVDAVFRAYAVKIISNPETVVSPRKIWENLFINFFCRSKNIPNAAMVVIDGLDEAPKETVKEFFCLLEDMTDTSGEKPRLSFAIFGRPDLAEHVESKLQRMLSKIEVGQKNEFDIGLFLKKHINEVAVVREVFRSNSVMAARRLAREIRDKIMAKADGMFFKVFLIMEQIKHKERKEDVIKAIEDAPPKLENMIGRIFDRLDQDDDVSKDDLNEILTWVAFSKVPLSIADLYAILKTRNGQAYDTLEARLRGKFASIFELEERYTRQKDEQTDDFQEDGLFDIDLLEDDEDAEQELMNEKNSESRYQTEKIETLQDDNELNQDTIERFQGIDVRFTHASILDFLAKDWSLMSQVPSIHFRIGFDVKVADMHIAFLCMDSILKDDFSGVKCNILFYAAEYFMDHLMSIDASKIGSDEKQPIIHQLCRLFFDPAGLRKLIRAGYEIESVSLYLYRWFECPIFSTMIRRDWLSSAIQDQYTAEESEWIRNATNSRREFFEPLAKQASYSWLTKSGNDDPEYNDDQFLLYSVWILHCYLNMDVSNDQEVKILNIGGLTPEWPPADELKPLQELAEFFNLEKTQHWHTCFAGVLTMADLYEDALRNYILALEIDGTSWKALQGKSMCLIGQAKYDEASQSISEAFRVVPNGHKSAVSDLQKLLIEMSLTKLDFTVALQLAQDFYCSDPTSLDAIELYVKALYAAKNYDKIIQIIEDDMKKSKILPEGSFTELMAVHHELGCAFRIQGKIEVLKLWISAWLSFEVTMDPFSSEPWLAAELAEFMYTFYDEIDDSITMFEYILSPKFRAALGPGLAWAYENPSSSASIHLSYAYFQKALSAHKAGEATSPWIERLKGLSISDTRNSEGELVYKMNIASHLLGFFLRRYEGADESIWKPCFRESVMKGIHLLCDTDITNDAGAYWDLGEVLILAGSRSAAVEAWAVYFKPFEATSNMDLLQALKAINFKNDRWCDGLCCTKYQYYTDNNFKEFYICEECVNTGFCQDCILVVKRGELPFRRCSPDHSFVQMLPIPSEARDVAARFVDMKTMEVQKDWLDALRLEWAAP